MSKILVTGGSGFIGTNLVEYLISKKHDVVNFDIKEPRNKKYQQNWIKGDILNKAQLEKYFLEINPEYIVHLAARTDLDEKRTITGYSANIEGLQNVIEVINTLPDVKRVIYASSRMVCKIDYVPTSFDDFCPPNLYGESKVIGEKMVKSHAKHDYIIVRPTSIWGPFFEIPYRTFFDTIKNKMFFIPKNHNPNKSFGFILNTVYQLEKMLFEPKENLEQNYYLTDYPALKLKTWADMIALDFHNKKTLEIPMLPLKIISKIGDFLKFLGWKNPPLTTFRLNNLITNMVYDTTNLEKLCGNLPYNLEDGVKITTNWMRKND